MGASGLPSHVPPSGGREAAARSWTVPRAALRGVGAGPGRHRADAVRAARSGRVRGDGAAPGKLPGAAGSPSPGAPRTVTGLAGQDRGAVRGRHSPPRLRTAGSDGVTPSLNTASVGAGALSTGYNTS